MKMIINFIVSLSFILISNVILIFFIFYNIWNINEIVTFYIAETIIVNSFIIIYVIFNKNYRNGIIDILDESINLFWHDIYLGRFMSNIIFFLLFFLGIIIFIIISMVSSNFIFNYLLDLVEFDYYKYLYKVRWVLIISLIGYILQFFSKNLYNSVDDGKKEFEILVGTFIARWGLLPAIGIFGVFGIDIWGNKKNILFPILFILMKLICDLVGIFLSFESKTTEKNKRRWINA
ncbi:MAG: hypothetical protein KA059_01835 [Elusimicrobiales bacterium]|jgi:hypothetical protein|nr:hypothetical protein [Elusimicrobiales bacterium]